MSQESTAVIEEVIDNGPSQQDLADFAAIDALATQFQGQMDAEASPAANEAPAEGQEAKAEEKLPEDPPPPDDVDTDTNDLASLVAREVELKRGQEALSARETAIQAENEKYQARIAELEQQVAGVPSEALGQLGTSPAAALKALGHDPEQVMRLYLAERFVARGEPVPADLQTAIREAKFASEVADLKRNQAAFQRQQEAQAFAAQVERGAQEFLRTEIKDAPLFAHVAKNNAARAFDEIMTEIAQDAARNQGNPKAKLLSYADAVKRVETRWNDLRKLTELNPGTTTITPPAGNTQPKVTGAPVVKAPLTKKPPPKTEAQLLEESINQIAAEHKAQAQKKPAVQA